MKNPLISLLTILTFCYLVAFAGDQATFAGMSWYLTLAKPAWALHPSLFAPAWVVFYGLLGTSMWRVLRTQEVSRQKSALLSLLAQLFLGGAWPWVFFVLRESSQSAVISALLFASTIMAITVALFIDRLTAFMQVIILFWSAYLFALSMAIYRMNG